MTERLEQVLEAQREFVGNASHQLRTPLTGLRLRIEAAGMKSDDPAVQKELELAEAEVERLTRLLNALLTLARDGERPTLRAPASLRARPRRRYERWLPRAEASGHVLTLDGDGDALVRAGEEDVAIALDNLIENALVYAPAGTTVTVTWDDQGRLAVLDEGPGVRPGSSGTSSSASGAGAPTGPGAASAWRSWRRSRGAGAARRRSAHVTRAGRAPRSSCRPSPDDTDGGELMRTVLLGLLGLALAVAVGLGVHLITRSTISLPVVQLEQPPPVASSGDHDDDDAADDDRDHRATGRRPKRTRPRRTTPRARTRSRAFGR